MHNTDTVHVNEPCHFNPLTLTLNLTPIVTLSRNAKSWKKWLFLPEIFLNSKFGVVLVNIVSQINEADKSF